jgi:hypothetical protein
VAGLIAASLILIAVSAGILVFGWLGESQVLIWASITASVAAAVTLVTALGHSRDEVERQRPRPRRR